MNWVYDDGGRKAAGLRGKAGDSRSIAIATRLSYAPAGCRARGVAPASSGSGLEPLLRSVDVQVSIRLSGHTKDICGYWKRPH